MIKLPEAERIKRALARRKKFEQEHRESLAAYQKEYKQKNKKRLTAYQKEYQAHNALQIALQKKRYAKINSEHISAYQKEYNKKNIEQKIARDKKYYELNKDKILRQTKDYYTKNKDILRPKRKEYSNNRRKTNIQARISDNLRNRLRAAVKNGYKSGSAVRDLGCTIPELKFYLEGKFRDGMSWENWSLNGWHLDHVIPLSFFDLTDRQQLLQAVHYTNLQPMWAVDNLHKYSKLPVIMK